MFACLAIAMFVGMFLSFAGSGLSVRDLLLKGTIALPNGANTVYTAGIDLGAQSGKQDFVANCEFLITAPALVVGDLGNGDTMKYSLQSDNDSAFGSPATFADLLTQTGAGGVGAAAATVRFRPPTDCERYWRLRAINSAAGDASDKSGTLELLV